MRNLAYLLPLVLLAATACDEPTADTCVEADGLRLAPPANVEQPDISLRDQGPPEASYIQTWNGKPITIKEFAAAVLACPDPKNSAWLLTLSAYKPDSTKDARVVGLGGSVILGEALWSCYRKRWLENNAIDF